MVEIDEAFKKKLKKDYGNVLIGASQIVETPLQVIPVSPSLDIALRGGIQEGRWVTLSGAKKCGKTTLSLHIAGKAQQMGKLVLYANAEGRLKTLNLEGVRGLDIEKLNILTSTEGKILTAQEFLTITANFIKLHPGSVVIIDSISALCSSEEMGADIDTGIRPAGPRLLAQFFRQLGQVVPLQKNIVICIHHLMSQQGKFTSGKIEDGGDKAQYQSDTKLRCKYTEDWKEGGKSIGHLIHWDLAWSAMGPPVDDVSSSLRYGTGIDEVSELVTLANDFALITGSGWYNLDFLVNSADKKAKKFIEENKKKEGEFKIQGQANVVTFLNEHPEFTALLYEEVRKMSA